MTKKKPAPTQAEAEPETTPATTAGEQGGTSQPGPPSDPNAEPVGEVDFAKPGEDSSK